MTQSHRKTTVERLRADIDAGRTRDKVHAPDPAAAPLGTDDEAAGTPASAETVAAARSREMPAPAGQPHAGRRTGFMWLLVTIVALGVIAVVWGAGVG